jgi:regulator of protease activity HflC (stomatin/prohibitin superfamily)
MGFLVFLAVLAVVVVAIIARGMRAVPQGYQWTVERFGRYRVTLSPGLRLINPFIDRIGRRINVQEAVLEIPAQSVITKDNASVVVDGIVFFQVIDASRAAYEVQNLQAAVVNLCMTNIRTAIGALDLDETLSHRDEINERLLRVLDAATEPWGTKITRVELKDVRPPEDVQLSMAKQLMADRERRAAVLRAEGIKQAAILEAEGAKQAQILAAEGRLAAAQRDAEARERLAAAEAKATSLVSDAVTGGNVQALNYFVAQKYVEAMTQIGQSPNARLVMMPLDKSGLVTTVAGIAELARGGLGPQRGGGGSCDDPLVGMGGAGGGDRNCGAACPLRISDLDRAWRGGYKRCGVGLAGADRSADRRICGCLCGKLRRRIFRLSWPRTGSVAKFALTTSGGIGQPTFCGRAKFCNRAQRGGPNAGAGAGSHAQWQVYPCRICAVH